MVNPSIEEITSLNDTIQKLNINYYQQFKIQIHQKQYWNNISQKRILQEKVQILKNMNHRNLVNVRNVQWSPKYCIMQYGHAPIKLQAITQINQQIFKQLHKQMIQLIINLAKNYILTSFHSNRCGIIVLDNQPIIKYYLPPRQIKISEDISLLQRSVKLFKVQAMHFLDSLNKKKQLSTQSTLEQESKQTPFRSSVQCERKKSFQLINRKLSYFESNKRKISQDSTAFTQSKLSQLKIVHQNIKIRSQRNRNRQIQRRNLKQRISRTIQKSRAVLLIFNEIKYKLINILQIIKVLQNICQ